MAAKIMAVFLCVFLLLNCGGRQPTAIDPTAAIDPERTYVIEYWDAEPPLVLDPSGCYRPEVERLAAEFEAANPGILIRIRWLNWVEAEAELARALQQGAPPDIFGDWQGLARRDHVLQVIAEPWLPVEKLTFGGKQLVAEAGILWAWPRWLWPAGLIVSGSLVAATAAELEQLVAGGWDWPELADWLEQQALTLAPTDWEGEFTAQALLTSSGAGWGQWSGQELHQVFAGLELLRSRGLIATGSLAQAKDSSLIGGVGPAALAWLAATDPGQQALMLPLPAVSPRRCLPITGTNLIQFQRLKTKGDDHCRAAALAAEYMAVTQGSNLAQQFGAISAWLEPELGATGFGPGYTLLLAEAAAAGAPCRAVDSADRQREQLLRSQAASLLAEFWAGQIGAAELAAGFEGFE